MTSASGTSSDAPGSISAGIGLAVASTAPGAHRISRSAAGEMPLPALLSSSASVNVDSRPFCCASAAPVVLRFSPSATVKIW